MKDFSEKLARGGSGELFEEHEGSTDFLDGLFDSTGAYVGPVVVIVGPTASGKTGAAIELALKIGGEVISADSRAIYKYMDIGTAKPSVHEMCGVPHFGIDLVEPGERFTVADFKEYALSRIAEIRARGHVPIIAGGTGLYVDAVIFDYRFDNKDIYHGTKLARGNRKKGTRGDVLETAPNNLVLQDGYLVYGIAWSSDELRERIRLRVQKMYSDELFSETRFLVEKYGWGSQAMKSDAYQFAWKYLNGEMTLDEATLQNFYRDSHLAKRQMTWFKRNKNIKWCAVDKIVDEIVRDLGSIE